MARIKKAAATIIDRGGEVLLLQRSNEMEYLPGFWNLPGGGVERKESYRNAAIREAKEECGLTLFNVTKVMEMELPYGSNVVRVHYFYTSSFTGKVKLNFESIRGHWVPVEILDRYLMITGNLEVLRYVFEDPPMC